MPPNNIYEIYLHFTNPDENDSILVPSENAIRALHSLQTNLDNATLHRIVDVSVSMFDMPSKTFIDLSMDRICEAWVQYIHTLP